MTPKPKLAPATQSDEAVKRPLDAVAGAAEADAPHAAGRGGRRRGRGRPSKEREAPAVEEADDESDAALDSDDDAGDGDSAAPAAPARSDNPLSVPPGKTVVIGVTGEPGAGKSSLARQLVALGATLIDVDELGHELIETAPVKRRLASEFGDAILDDEGGIDRRKLGAKAFANAQSTAKLNEIVHPKLAARAKADIKKAGNFVVVDCALLHELGLAEVCTTTIYVRASREARIGRVAERGWDEAELGRRESALGNADARRKACQLAVDNSGDPALLAAYAKNILARQLGVDLAALRRQEQPAAERDDADDAQDDGADEAAAAPAGVAETPRPQMRAAGDARPGGFPQQDRQGFAPREGFPPRDQRQGFDRQQQPQGQHPQGQQGQPGQQGQQQNRFEDPNRPPVKVDLDDYLKRILPDLQNEADKLEVRDVKWLKKHDLICEILRRVAGGRNDIITVEGFIEMVKDQHAFIRSPINNYLAVNTDAFIALQQLRRYGLKEGMHVTGTARAPRGNERCPQLLSIETVMGEPVDKRTPVQDFEHLVPLHAYERLFMELPNDPSDVSLRIFDLVSPIGKGQRGLIVAQPKCGKTVYMQKIAKAIATNNPEVTLMVLLVDERPEEVTDMQRTVKGEVIASTFDQHASRHVQCAEIVINKAKRLVERGKDVVILLDSITRLARAYNTMAPNSGRILSGGIDSNALIKPKQFFGAARKVENGGSLTILATAIVDTGSLMDTVIFEEFKGTGNMEIVLDRRIANRRVFPAVDCAASGTRKDELLITNKDELARVWALRKFLADRNGQDAVEFLRSKLKNFRTNVEFLMSIDPEKLSGW
jgi:transcription termination factor Rho